jgi:hypothetical protein
LRSEYAAYCLDGATATFGITVENALAETVEVGIGETKKHVAKYTIGKLLGPNFVLPRPGDSSVGDMGLLKSAAGGFYDEVS